TGTVTIPKTTGYNTLLNYWKGSGAKPSVETAKTYLMEQAEMMKLQNCVIHRDVLDAMFRQAQGDKSPMPFKKHTAPGTIYAVDYDLGGNNRAYFDVDSANYKVSTEVYTAWNTGYAYRNDAVDIEACKDAAGNNGYNVGWTNDNEWMVYTVDIDSSAVYQFDLRYAAAGSAGRFHLQLDGVDITPIISLTASGGWTTWKTHTLNNVILSKGTHQIKLYIDKAGFNINYLKFSNPKELAGVLPEILNSKTDQEGKSIYLTSNVSFDGNSSPLATDFSVTVNGKPVATDTVYLDTQSSYGLVVKVDQQLKSTDVILLSYHGNTLKTPSGLVFGAMENIKVFNNSPLYVTLPGTIQAEKFNVNVGLSLETCTDTGGGQNIAYTNTGDYLDYFVSIPTNGTYSIDYRVASTAGGTIELRLADNPSAPVTIHSVTVPNTGGWQTWRTVTATGQLPQGTHTLRVFIKKQEFNLNWFKVSLVTSSSSIDDAKKVEVYPNPANDYLHLKTSGLKGSYRVKISSLQGAIVKQFTAEITPGADLQMNVSSLAEGTYIFTMENKSEKHYSKFIKKK
ncbi:MAG TPA: carbohydrate-binding protein, partial [Prolixibacteraceae bacterium]|nr:carbohydrate-binding protein [Prolixibacteraceae bacterium]